MHFLFLLFIYSVQHKYVHTHKNWIKITFEHSAVLFEGESFFQPQF